MHNLSKVPYPSTTLLDPGAETLLPVELDGSSGGNRATGNHPQIAARNDPEAIRAWLARYADTPTTFQSYRKEAERLLLWSVLQAGKPLSSLTHEDLLHYQEFLADPQPVERWIMPVRRKVPRADPRWRPFAGPLAPTSRRQAIIILNALFAWLVGAGYLAGNPLALSRRRARKAKPRIARYLDETLWSEVKLTIESLPRETPRDRAHHLRVRWLFSLLYLCGLRISEVAGNTMGGFFRRSGSDGGERWWLEITGKGHRTRLVPATGELMAELARYRQAHDLPSLPQTGEETPLLLPIHGRPEAMTRSAVHLIVKTVFSRTAERLRAAGPDRRFQADLLEQASAHWLRHTAGSRMADGQLDLRHVRDNLGHANLSTTSHYLHAEDDERHRETEERHRLDW
ncbi:MAG: integrase [Candidatus Competibacteraceae bacterium]|nr:MAG: integrase [Candidatus Competibacteraceae bacterium]